MHDAPPRAVYRGRHRLVYRRRRLLVATAGIVVTGLSLSVVINASTDVRPSKRGQSLASVGGEPAGPTTPPAGGTWAPNVQYTVGAQVTHGGVGYRCRQAHRSLVTWEPPNTPALWQRL
jgi:hypothetical protein